MNTKDIKMLLNKSIPRPREISHTKQQKMKSFQLNPISLRSADGTKHAEQVHAPENSFVNMLELFKRN